jgi:hypothetical protein
MPYIAEMRAGEEDGMALRDTNVSYIQTESGRGFACDCCGETWSPPNLSGGSKLWDISQSWELAKLDGWRAVDVVSYAGKKDWEHRCRDCA